MRIRASHSTQLRLTAWRGAARAPYLRVWPGLLNACPSDMKLIHASRGRRESRGDVESDARMRIPTTAVGWPRGTRGLPTERERRGPIFFTSPPRTPQGFPLIVAGR